MFWEGVQFFYRTQALSRGTRWNLQSKEDKTTASTFPSPLMWVIWAWRTKFSTQISGAIRRSCDWHLLPCALSSSTFCSRTRGHDEHPDPEGAHQRLQEGQGGEDGRQQVRGRGEEGAVQEVGLRQGAREDEGHEQVLRAGWSFVLEQHCTLPRTYLTLPFVGLADELFYAAAGAPSLPEASRQKALKDWVTQAGHQVHQTLEVPSQVEIGAKTWF